MKKGINAWAFPASMSVRDTLKYARKAGYESIELNLAEKGEIGLETAAADLKRIAAAAKRTGIEISSVSTGLYWAYNGASDDAEERKRAGQVLATQIRTAQALGCDAILLIAGSVMSLDPSRPKIDPDVCWERALALVRAATPQAEDAGVSLCIENVWNGFLLTATEVRDFVDAAGSPRVAAYFDVANCVKFGVTEQWVRVLGKRIRRVHFKDFRRSIGGLDGFVHLLEGDVDYPAVMKAFQQVGYRGFVTAEIFPYARGLWESQVWTISKAMDFILGRAK